MSIVEVVNYRRLTSGRLYIFAAHDLMQRSADMAYPYHQEPNFFWLTNIREAGWLCVVDTASMRMTLLAPHRDATRTLFDGSLDYDDALKLSGAEAVIPYDEREKYLREMAQKFHEVWALEGHTYADPDVTENPSRARLATMLSSVFEVVNPCRKELSKLRAIKSESEITQLRRAIAASITGFEQVRGALERNELSFEYEAESLLNSAFRQSGTDGHAYDPIVASGAHACTLHYAQNNDELQRGTLLLIDAGASASGYAADITRTYAVGSLGERQVAVHEAVQRAHRRIIDLIAPGKSIREYIDESDGIIKKELIALGLIESESDTEGYRTYFPHAISHGLGLDVHESLGGFDTFQAGMVLTVEPGIYIPEERIGVRIEDDILVTEDGNENLSAALPISL